MASNGSRSRVLSLDALAQALKTARAKRLKIVHCHGVFDLLHPGHIRHLQAAKHHGDVLVVTITRDEYVNKGPGRPVFPQQLRAESLAALGCVDYVAINDTPTAVEAIRKIRPHFYVKGNDYKDHDKDVTGGIRQEEKAAKSVGAKLVITEEPMLSSTQLLNQHFGVYPPDTRAFLDSFSKRHSSDSIIRSVESLRKLKVLVVGEAIVDEYHYCQAMGKSPKETIVSTRFIEAEAFAGGSLAAANHLSGFASEVQLVACLGQEDSREAFIRSRLKPNVKPKFFLQKGASSIIKRRFVDPAFLTKMFEVSYLSDKELPAEVEAPMLRHLEAELPKFDLVLVTDYGHGMLGPRAVDLLCHEARFLCVNTQTNSANIGYNVITKYPKAHLACIDEPELRMATRDRHGPVETLLLDVAKQLRTEQMIVTRGHKGSLAYSRKEGFTSIPVFSSKVVDRVGAGDAYLSLASLCAAGGLPIDVTAFVGNAAGAMKVGTVCNRTPIEAAPLFKFLTAMLK